MREIQGEKRREKEEKERKKRRKVRDEVKRERKRESLRIYSFQGELILHGKPWYYHFIYHFV